jgi:hypothetical protein
MLTSALLPSGHEHGMSSIQTNICCSSEVHSLSRWNILSFLDSLIIFLKQNNQNYAYNLFPSLTAWLLHLFRLSWWQQVLAVDSFHTSSGSFPCASTDVHNQSATKCGDSHRCIHASGSAGIDCCTLYGDRTCSQSPCFVKWEREREWSAKHDNGK